MLKLQDVRYRYLGATRDALAGVSLSVGPGEFHAVLGPNGSGKTTLVRIALGALKPLSGRADIDGRPASEWARRNLARLVGVVPQREDNLFPQRVRETVLLGRYPYLSLWGRERAEDHAAVDRALAACDATDLADRWVWTLSGGEYQRVRVARALAQEPRLLVLDEPTAIVVEHRAHFEGGLGPRRMRADHADAEHAAVPAIGECGRGGQDGVGRLQQDRHPVDAVVKPLTSHDPYGVQA